MSEDQDKTPPSDPFGSAPSAPSFGSSAPPPSTDPTAPPAPPAAAGPPTAPPPPGGSFPPPGPAYPPPGGSFPPPGAGPAGIGGPSTDSARTMILVAHFGGAGAAFISGGTLGWVGPLIAMVTEGARQPLVRAHAVEAINFQITWAIASVIAYVLAVCSFGILFFLPFVTVVIAVVFGIIAGVKASNGEAYRYPLKFSLVK